MGSYDCGSMNWLHSSLFLNHPKFLVHHVVLHAHPDVAAHGDGSVQHLHGGVAHAEAAPGGAGAKLLHGLLHEHQIFHAAGDAVGAATEGELIGESGGFNPPDANDYEDTAD